MADDDEMTPDEPDEVLEEEEEQALEDEPDVEELDEDEDGEFALEDDEDGPVVDETVEEEDEEDDADEAPTTRTSGARRRCWRGGGRRGRGPLAPDDVEADLDRILKDRLVTVEDEEDEDEEEPDERGDPGDRLQPKRADEQLCPNCFLLVRANAPGVRWATTPARSSADEWERDHVLGDG